MRPAGRGAHHKLPYGSRLLADDGATVEKGQTLVTWDPYTLPIITEKEGYADYVDLLEGVSVREILDEATGITSESGHRLETAAARRRSAAAYFIAAQKELEAR